MVVRGAPAIGITAAYGMAMAARQEEDLVEARAVLAKSRPTAVNLAWALERVGLGKLMENCFLDGFFYQCSSCNLESPGGPRT